MKGVTLRAVRLVWLCAAVLACNASSAGALSEGRKYEMVSPVFKGGYGVGLLAAALDGESVVYGSLGVFAGTPRSQAFGTDYMARRTDEGWQTVPIEAPFDEGLNVDFSSNLEYVVAINGNAAEGEYLLHSTSLPDASQFWEPFDGTRIVMKPQTGNAITAAELGADRDLCHLVIEGSELLAVPPNSKTLQFYEYRRSCEGKYTPAFKFIAVKNSLGPEGEEILIKPECPEALGVSSDYQTGPFGREQLAYFNALSTDGRETFFTADAHEGVHAKCPAPVPQLFVRLDGIRTVEVSRPVEPEKPFGGCGEGSEAGEVPGEVPCPGAALRLPAYFKGASEDGSRAFFMTGARLVESDHDSTNKLYMATIGCPMGSKSCDVSERRVTSLTDISHGDPGEAGEVQGVVSIAENGERVYFVARGVLTGNPSREGTIAVKGADNLYVYDTSTGQIEFIADLCSGPDETGPGPVGAKIEDAHCPTSLSEADSAADTGLWGDDSEAQSSPDGRYLVFSSVARLIDGGLQVDIDNSKDVYRYDAVTGELERVSVGEGGYDGNGNGEGYDATIPVVGISPGGNGDHNTQQREMATRAMGDDGRRIVFMTTEPLSATASNGRNDVYIWHKEMEGAQGRVSLISSGTSETDDRSPVIGPSGVDVFLDTTARLVASDTESDEDVYDARIGELGGQPAPHAECSADGCQGPLTNPAPLLAPGSMLQEPEAQPSLGTHKTKKSGKRSGRRRKTKGSRRLKRRRGRARKSRRMR